MPGAEKRGHGTRVNTEKISRYMGEEVDVENSKSGQIFEQFGLRFPVELIGDAVAAGTAHRAS